MRGFDHLADLWTTGGLDDHAVPSAKLKTGGVEVVDLDPARKHDPYYFGH
jgi:hypothetical protein